VGSAWHNAKAWEPWCCGFQWFFSILLWLLGRIQPPEVLEHEPPLVGSEVHQLFPCRVAQPGPGARGAGLEHAGDVHAVAGGRAAGALLVLVRLPAGERPTGVEEAAVQALLTLDCLGVEPSRFELPGELAGLPRERSRRGARALRLHARELVSERALPRRQRAELLQHGLAACTHHREQAARLPVQGLLVASEAGELLDRFGEAAARLRAGDLAAA